MADPTHPELVVIALMSRGHTYDAIARALVLSVDAVKSRVARARQRTGAKSTIHLVALCMARHLIPLLREDHS